MTHGSAGVTFERMLSIRYYLPIVFQLTGIVGIFAGGAWTWIGIAQLVGLAVANAVLDDDLRQRPVANTTLMDVPVALGAVLGFVVVSLVAWRAGQGGLSSFEIAGMIVTGGWLTVLVMVPTTHELYHKRTPWKYSLGLASQLVYLDYMRSAPHVLGHHFHVGTPKDHDTALRGESMYGFVVRVSLANFREAWEWEKAALARRGLPFWSLRGRIGKAAAGFLAMLVLLYAIGGLAGLVPPIWNRYILQPQLRHWDTHFANAAERELAREANRRAGWPDWLAA